MERLKSKRTSRRSLNTRIINEARALLSDATATVDQLNAIYGRLKANNDELNQINQELESHIADEEFEQEYNTVVEYEDNATSVMSELLSKRDRMVAAISSTPELQTSSVASTAGASGTKLPKLTIAPFAGDLCRWNDFWEQFDQMIHRNGSLTATDKFNYLRFFLRGDAASAIVGLPTTEACYKDAIDILKRRFGDKTRLEQEYFSRLRTLPSVRSSDLTALRKLYDQVVINIRGLETLGRSMVGRMVGASSPDDKASTEKVLGKARLNFEELTTVLTEVEAVVNSRPLTFIESDSAEPRALTPADLIIGRRLTTLPQGSNDMPMDLTRKEAQLNCFSATVYHAYHTFHAFTTLTGTASPIVQ
ncbi:uncharacterized protein LOC125759434 [Rhipicephalus sanguineus]|uniref:uncharacterized protein LOC125759434 n=1 Tax=Rhipicephalus sanguineus TaxID=34632 RepID=UPI0020C29192|nr:uncharacterized protein LOC125759434 [Rhipicephalus sanguineus]